jgi:hypothetical protein
MTFAFLHLLKFIFSLLAPLHKLTPSHPSPVDLRLLGTLSINNVASFTATELHAALLFLVEVVIPVMQRAPQVLDISFLVENIPGSHAGNPFAGLQDEDEGVETRDDFI